MGECLMFGLDLESRTLCSSSDEDTVRFLIGTNNIKLDNQVDAEETQRNIQICRLTVEGDYSRIASTTFIHPNGEVRALASCPTDAEVVACVSADYRESSPKFGIHLYKLDDEKGALEELKAENSQFCYKSFEWEPQNNKGSAINDSHLQFFDMEGLQKLSNHELGGTIHAQAYSPHNNGSVIGLAIGRSLMNMDTRTIGEGISIEKAHPHRTLHLDFNPNLQYCVASCGDDGAIRIWDWRNTNQALLALQPHAHWAWQVKFHPVHDQMVLSAGSDACVVLSCVQSVSSEKMDEQVEDEEETETERLTDGQLERIEEHEESVYACSWSTSDPWAFASLSYDGRVVISRVKRKHKYALLQL